VYEPDPDSVGIDEVEHRPEAIGYFPDFRSRNSAGIAPNCLGLQLFQRLGF
jgi:hypothetical protein